MAKEYFQKLSSLIDQLNLQTDLDISIDIRHFFNGAGLYVNGAICASLSPAGLAFKLQEDEVAKLIHSGKAKPLKYFAKGHIKKGYALFENPDLTKLKTWKRYFMKAAQLNT